MNDQPAESVRRAVDAALNVSMMLVDTNGAYHSGFLTEHSARWIVDTVIEALQTDGTTSGQNARSTPDVEELARRLAEERNERLRITEGQRQVRQEEA